MLTGWEVLAIKNRIREVQAMKASARATKASAVVGLAGDQSIYFRSDHLHFHWLNLFLSSSSFYLIISLSQEWEIESAAG